MLYWNGITLPNHSSSQSDAFYNVSGCTFLTHTDEYIIPIYY